MARKKPGAGRRGRDDRSVTSSLRDAITARDLTDYALGKLADVDPCVIGRFMRSERDVRGSTIDRLASALGLSLGERSRGRGRPTGPGREPTVPANPGIGFEAVWVDPPNLGQTETVPEPIS